jgi:septal ring factor EnvC (AmiA/AmiB activator)
MTTTPDDTSSPQPDIEQLQAEIEQTREQLGETVDALTAKLDVKSRTRARLNATKQNAGAKLGEGRAKAVELTSSARSAATTPDGKPTPPVLVGLGVTVVALVAATVLVWRKRR